MGDLALLRTRPSSADPADHPHPARPPASPPLPPPEKATSAQTEDDPRRGVPLILAAISLFSVSDALAKHLGQMLPPVEVAWLRYATFFLLTLVPILRGGFGVVRSRAPGLQVLRGLALVGSALCFIAALRTLPLAEATAINFVSPIFITALSIPILGEVVGIRRWAAVAVGLAGVLLVVRPFGGGGFGAEVLLPVLTAASWALAVVVTRKMAGADRSRTTLFWSAAVGFALLSALLPFDFVVPTASQLGLGLLLGLISSAGQGLIVLAYRHAAASVLAPFAYGQLLSSTLIGFLAFGAAPDAWTLAGAAVIVGSGIYTAHRERVRARERAAAAATAARRP
jgi:drug/metabolite transporter (DMT)-like permease